LVVSRTLSLSILLYAITISESQNYLKLASVSFASQSKTQIIMHPI
jgi:hypothetical protein